MALLTSVPHDRMRIVAPIGPEAKLTDQQRKRMLDANFHSALDVRYATSKGLVYAAYIHPLSTLRREEVQSALRQVAELVKTFGSTYFQRRAFVWTNPAASSPGTSNAAATRLLTFPISLPIAKGCGHSLYSLSSRVAK